MQARIGRLFACFALLDSLYAFGVYLFGGGGATVGYAAAVIFLCSALFFYTGYLDRFGQYIQIALVVVISIPTLCFCTEKVFGVMIVFVAFALAVGYGFISKHRNYKLAGIALSVHALLFACEKQHNIETFARSLLWLAFLIFFSLVLWFIFKDAIRKNREDDIRIERDIMKSIIKTNDELMKLAKKLYLELNIKRGL